MPIIWQYSTIFDFKKSICFICKMNRLAWFHPIYVPNTETNIKKNQLNHLLARSCCSSIRKLLLSILCLPSIKAFDYIIYLKSCKKQFCNIFVWVLVIYYHLSWNLLQTGLVFFLFPLKLVRWTCVRHDSRATSNAKNHRNNKLKLDFNYEIRNKITC